MPISRDYLDNEPRQSGHNTSNASAPRYFEENNDAPTAKQSGEYPSATFGQHRGSEQAQRPESREELIARIKKDQKPIWLQDTGDVVRSTGASPPLQLSLRLPAAVLDGRGNEEMGPTALELASGIERPKSALHAGDFREEQEQSLAQRNLFDFDRQESATWTSTSPTDPWYSPLFSVPRHPPLFEGFSPAVSRPLPAQARSRAASQSSLSSSFVLRTPTSPLAQASETSDLDDRNTERTRSRSPKRSSRRHTFSPRSLRNTQFSPIQQMPSLAHGRPYPTLRREETNPYQRRDSRRSIAALSSLQNYSTPQTPLSRSRRSSILSDGSPLQAPLVGGYEESILRGRMSTLPSRPLDFVAQIGVLGKGDCKKSLQCPPHISIPFPAVYYNYGNTREGTSTSEGPSPYVGLINMENISKDRVHLASNGARRPETPASDVEMIADDNAPGHLASDVSPNLSHRKNRQRLHYSTTSKKPPSGGYRIPQQGQLQIIIKNPNKTAVKLFLIPYDLAGMEPGQKTFIRQRSYSAGPIIDMPLSCRKNFGSDRPEASLSNSTDPNDRPVLRYLIHLHICCPSRGRFYLYRSIRVVFANRVPDGKEKLRNEIQLPEPRYSAFKPDAEPTAPQKSRDNESPAIRQLQVDHGPPSLPTTQTEQEFGFRVRSGGDASIVHQLPLAGQLSFRRKPLPPHVSDGSSIGSGSSHRSDTMQADRIEGSTSPKSNGSPIQIESSFQSLDSDCFAFNRNNGDGNSSTNQNRSMERSPSPRTGLLSLQLRDFARNGAPHSDA